MEKRALLAALLSGVVLVVWYAFFMPSPAKAPVPTGSGTAAGAPAAATAGAGATPTSAPVPVEAPTTPAPAAVRGAAEERIELSGPGWHATVSSRGGIVRSITLSDYKDERGQPVELMSGDGVLGIAGAGPWNDEAYTVERAGEGVTLRWSDGKGNWVEKHLAPARGRYGMTTEVRMGGEPARLGVTVGAGVGPLGTTTAERRSLGVAGALVRLDGKLMRIRPEKLKGTQEVHGTIEFAGAEDQYFLVVLLPEGPLAGARLDLETAPDHTVVRVAALGQDGVVRGTLLAGPKERDTLVAYGRGLDETLSFGIFGFFTVIFLTALRWIHSWSGNWGVAIILLTAGIRVLLFPLTHKSTVAMKKMQTVQPKLKAIQERYKERAKKDPKVRERMNQEVMQLYKQEGVNPLGGCLPTLVQLPILWALYTLFAYAIELRHAPLAWWIQDLSVKDPYYITPILMTASMVLQQRLTPQVGDPAQRRMFMMMPFIFGFMFMNFPAGLVLYWLVNNVLTIGQQLLTERILRNAPGPAAV